MYMCNEEDLISVNIVLIVGDRRQTNVFAERLRMHESAGFYSLFFLKKYDKLFAV